MNRMLGLRGVALAACKLDSASATAAMVRLMSVCWLVLTGLIVNFFGVAVRLTCRNCWLIMVP